MTGRLIPILLTLLLAGANTLPELMRRAEKGDGEALYHLAMLYDSGCDTIRPDTARSTALYIRAAEAGNIEAQNYLGYRLYKGEGAERDPEQALQWLETAAMAGSAKAASNLGFCPWRGRMWCMTPPTPPIGSRGPQMPAWPRPKVCSATSTN